jgi:hypothetical protein
MLTDKSLWFADAQAVTVDAIGDTYVPQGAADQALAHPLSVEFRVDTAMTSAGGTATVTFGIITASTGAGLTTSSTPVVSVTVAEATLVAGYTFRLPLNVDGMDKFIGVLFDVSTTLNGGKMDAYVVDTPYQR